MDAEINILQNSSLFNSSSLPISYDFNTLLFLISPDPLLFGLHSSMSSLQLFRLQESSSSSLDFLQEFVFMNSFPIPY